MAVVEPDRFDKADGVGFADLPRSLPPSDVHSEGVEHGSAGSTDGRGNGCVGAADRLWRGVPPGLVHGGQIMEPAIATQSSAAKESVRPTRRAMISSMGRRRTNGRSVVMLGDSLTAGGRWSTLLRSTAVLNEGHPGLTACELVVPARRVAARSPRAVILMAGTNDIRDGNPPDRVVIGLTQILEHLVSASPLTEVVIQSVLPRHPRGDKVAAMNQAIERLARDRSVTYLDLYPYFDCGDGRAPRHRDDRRHTPDTRGVRAVGAAASADRRPVPHEVTRHYHPRGDYYGRARVEGSSVKIRISLVVAALAVLATISAVDAPDAKAVAGFGDVEAGRYFSVPVQWMVDNDITTGTSPTCFSPADPVTRGQAAAFLYRIADEPSGAPAHPFDDVTSEWQQAPVSWMAASGITTGTSPTTYSPADTLTRGELAALLHRASGNPPAAPTTFPDVVRDWQIVAVGWLEQEGITTGTSPTTFSPESTVTRGEFATFAYRWQGSPTTTVDPASPSCNGSTPTTTTTTPSPDDPLPAPTDAVSEIDWWGCWRAEQARDANGSTPTNGERVSTLPNCASGPSSVGGQGTMSETGNDRPVYRPAGANGHPAIEFSYEGPNERESTLLRTNGGAPWAGSDVLEGGPGVTLAWIGMTTDVASHDTKYFVSGLSSSHSAPLLIVRADGFNRFDAWAGGRQVMESSNDTIVDYVVHGVIVYFAPDGSIEIDNSDFGSFDSEVWGEVVGLTLGNKYDQGFSGTDHQFVFLGLHSGPMSQADRDTFWAYLAHVREG